MYPVDKEDGTQEIELKVQLSAPAWAAYCAIYSISCVLSSLSTGYRKYQANLQATTQAKTFSSCIGPPSISSLFSIRSDISGYGGKWTPLHMACYYDKDEIALFLINEEKRRVSAEGEQQRHAQPGRNGGRSGGDQQQQTPSYNMQYVDGRTPVFWTESEKIVEEMLKLHDLELVSKDGRQLLEEGEDGFCWLGLGALDDYILQD